MTPAALMDTLQVVALLLVGAGATAVVRTRNRVRQVLALSVYGILLAILFLAFQAPDVTLSELTVGAVALPIVLLLAISKVHKRAQPPEPARPARPARPAQPAQPAQPDRKPER